MSGILGSWKGMLSRIETTHTPRPEGDVVAMPNGLINLCKAIEKLQHEQDNAVEQRRDFEAAWDAAGKEFAAAMDANAVWQRDIATRLYRLRMEWASVSQRLGVSVRVDQPPQAIFTQEEP
jgi:hypothetical protein